MCRSTIFQSPYPVVSYHLCIDYRYFRIIWRRVRSFFITASTNSFTGDRVTPDAFLYHNISGNHICSRRWLSFLLCFKEKSQSAVKNFVKQSEEISLNFIPCDISSFFLILFLYSVNVKAMSHTLCEDPAQLPEVQCLSQMQLHIFLLPSMSELVHLDAASALLPVYLHFHLLHAV